MEDPLSFYKFQWEWKLISKAVCYEYKCIEKSALILYQLLPVPEIVFTLPFEKPKSMLDQIMNSERLH